MCNFFFLNMWSIGILISLMVKMSSGYISANYYCADMNPQTHVDIEQLYGMWYGIEVISHHDEQHYTKADSSCPILHISEDKNYHQSSTYSPLYNNYDYRHNYGERRDPNRKINDKNRDYQYQYRKDIPSNNYNTRRRYGTPNNRIFRDQMKRLRIWWDENGTGTEYHLKYNISIPGFWISSGPQSGPDLEPSQDNFAGTVQVIKAVGNHLILTFCHQLPERQLVTIILSRENKLDFPDIHSAHTLLIRRGLSTNAIKKVCSNKGRNINILFSSFVLTVLVFAIGQ